MCRCIPQTNTVFGAYSIAHRGFTLTPAHNFAKKATVLTLSKKLSGGQLLKGSYSLKDKAAALELGIAPLTVRLPQPSILPCPASSECVQHSLPCDVSSQSWLPGNRLHLVCSMPIEIQQCLPMKMLLSHGY